MHGKISVHLDLPGAIFVVDTSGTSSANTTANPLSCPDSSVRWHWKKWGGDSLLQVPVNVAMKEPWARVVSEESKRNFISRITDAHDVADHRVVKVVGRVTSAADDVERVSVQVDRVLVYHNCQNPGDSPANLPTLTGPPATPAGMVISTLLLGSRP
jgi:hypothetical protein